jgi:large subunit ribosomal protein L15
MNLHNLKPAKGSVKKNTRKGRGQGSGKGGTSTRGHKGQKSRSGYSRKRNFEGGQMPIQMRLPKRGFKNINRTSYSIVNLSRLQEIADKHKTQTISSEFLVEKGIIGKGEKVKILGSGELKGALQITAHAYSDAAKEAIEKSGGSANTVS